MLKEEEGRITKFESFEDVVEAHAHRPALVLQSSHLRLWALNAFAPTPEHGKPPYKLAVLVPCSFASLRDTAKSRSTLSWKCGQ